MPPSWALRRANAATCQTPRCRSRTWSRRMTSCRQPRKGVGARGDGHAIHRIRFAGRSRRAALALGRTPRRKPPRAPGTAMSAMVARLATGGRSTGYRRAEQPESPGDDPIKRRRRAAMAPFRFCSWADEWREGNRFRRSRGSLRLRRGTVRLLCAATRSRLPSRMRPDCAAPAGEGELDPSAPLDRTRPCVDWPGPAAAPGPDAAPAPKSSMSSGQSPPRRPIPCR